MTNQSKELLPLTLPDNYNPDTFMLSKQTEYGLFHESRAAAGLAQQLVANGTPTDLALAEQVLEASLQCQELRESDPHYGNFMWMREDDVVFDLNAVEFVLEKLIPMMIQHGDRLPPALQTRVLDSIRLGLAEICKLDVLVAYSNITILDIVNSCLGGELLNDEQIAQRGYQKLVDWMALTDQFGIPFEYNSATYTAVTLRALKQLADLVQDEATRVRVKTAAARLGLSVALHIHRKTGRWAGPHSRAYHPSVVCETPPESERVQGWIEDGTLPPWIAHALTERPASMSVYETANVERNYTITTHHQESFVLGTSATEYGGQSNVCLAQYSRPQADRPGVFFTRYLLNDKWLGDTYHTTDRTKSRNLMDEGHFYGVQEGERAICLYSPANLGLCSSAKAALVWTERDQIDEIWVGQKQIETLPATVPAGEVVVIGSGEAWMAIRPLTISDIGRDAPIRLVERSGDLVLELYNYLGPEKHFWEMRWPGAFYQGEPQCGFYLEMAERDDYPDGKSFAEVVMAGQVVDEAAPPFVYAGEGERPWIVSYARDERLLGLEVDLMAWKLKRRWTHQGELGYPMLESPVARESRDGQITLGDAELSCGQEAGWLWAHPAGNQWVAGYHGSEPAPLTLKTSQGNVELGAITTGTVWWNDGLVTVEGLGVQAPTVSGQGRLAGG